VFHLSTTFDVIACGFAPRVVVIGQIGVQFDNTAEHFDLNQAQSEDGSSLYCERARGRINARIAAAVPNSDHDRDFRDRSILGSAPLAKSVNSGAFTMPALTSAILHPDIAFGIAAAVLLALHAQELPGPTGLLQRRCRGCWP